MPDLFPNPPVDVDALMAPMSADIVNTTIVNTLVTLGIRADLWPQEGALRSCMWAVSTVASGFINDRIAATKAGWLPTAFGAWLTWLAFYMYGVLRTQATFAAGAVTLANAAGGVFSFQPFTWTCMNPATGMTYTNTQAIALGAGPGTSQTLNIQATKQGSQGNAAPGEITEIVTTMLGVTCTNLAPVLGIDEQSDASLQLLCWNSIAANSPYGPAQSFGYAVQKATNAITGSPVNVNRFATSPSSHTGQVTILLASPEGAPDPNDVVGVQTSINARARPPNVQATAVGATNFFVTDTLTAYVTATPGLDASSVESAMAQALSAFFATYPISGQVGPNGVRGIFGTGLEGACFGAWPGVVAVVGAVDHPMVPGHVAIDETSIAVVLV